MGPTTKPLILLAFSCSQVGKADIGTHFLQGRVDLRPRLLLVLIFSYLRHHTRYTTRDKAWRALVSQ